MLLLKWCAKKRFFGSFLIFCSEKKKSDARANALFRLLHHYFVDNFKAVKSIASFGRNFVLIQRFRVVQNCVLEESRAWIIGVPAAAKKCSMRRDDKPLFTRGISPKKKLLRSGFTSSHDLKIFQVSINIFLSIKSFVLISANILAKTKIQSKSWSQLVKIDQKVNISL